MPLNLEIVKQLKSAIELCNDEEQLRPLLEELFAPGKRAQTFEILNTSLDNSVVIDLKVVLVDKKQPIANYPLIIYNLFLSQLPDSVLSNYLNQQYYIDQFFLNFNKFVIAETNLKTFKLWVKEFVLHKENFMQLVRLLNKPANDPQLLGYIQALLENLGVRAVEKEKLLKKIANNNFTVYQTFLELRKYGYIQIDYVLELLEKNKINTKTLLVVGGLAGSYLLSSLIFPHVLATLALVMANPLTLPILGFTITILATIAALYAFFNPQVLFASRVRDLSFSLITAVVNSVAYFMWWAAGTIMTPLVACLFLTSSLIDVVKECFCLIHERYRFQNYINSPDPREYIQHCFKYRKHRNAFLMGFAAAILLSLIMLGWCCFTGSWLTPTAVGLIIAIYLIKTTLNYYNEKIIRHNLQKNLEKVASKTSALQYYSITNSTDKNVLDESKNTSDIVIKHEVEQTL